MKIIQKTDFNINMNLDIGSFKNFLNIDSREVFPSDLISQSYTQEEQESTPTPTSNPKVYNPRGLTLKVKDNIHNSDSNDAIIPNIQTNNVSNDAIIPNIQNNSDIDAQYRIKLKDTESSIKSIATNYDKLLKKALKKIKEEKLAYLDSSNGDTGIEKILKEYDTQMSGGSKDSIRYLKKLVHNKDQLKLILEAAKVVIDKQQITSKQEKVLKKAVKSKLSRNIPIQGKLRVIIEQALAITNVIVEALNKKQPKSHTVVKSAVITSYGSLPFEVRNKYIVKGKTTSKTVRHDLGFATDLYLTAKNGGRLSQKKIEDLKTLQIFILVCKKLGITGVGMSREYPSSAASDRNEGIIFHIDIAKSNRTLKGKFKGTEFWGDSDKKGEKSILYSGATRSSQRVDEWLKSITKVHAHDDSHT
tara:strand:- start:513 stop:1763 length:1251 start_codon:yes stop_codon:yes gene_type:complete